MHFDSLPPIVVSPAVPQSGVEEMSELIQGADWDVDLPNKATITELRIDAELQSWIDPLTSDELAGLEASLLQDGCRDPLVVWADCLLDGHNRYALCQKHGIAFQTIEKTGLASKADAKIWMIENQLGKRNTSDFGRVALALRLKPLIEQRAQERMLAGKAQPAAKAPAYPVQNSAQGTGKSRDALAKAAGVSHDTVRKVEQIIAKATPEVVAKVRSGELSIHAAAKTVTPVKPVMAVALVPPENWSAPKIVAAPVEKPSVTDGLTHAKAKLEGNDPAALREDHALLMTEHKDLLAEHDELKASVAEKNAKGNTSKSTGRVTPAAVTEDGSDHSTLGHNAVAPNVTSIDQLLADQRAENEVLREQVRALQAQTHMPAGGTAPAVANQASLEVSAPDHVNPVVDELGHLRGQVAELEARLMMVLAENKMMETILAADDKVTAAMAEAKQQKAKANEENRVLYLMSVDLQSQVKKLKACVEAAESSKTADEVASST